MATAPVVRMNGEGEPLWVLGNLFEIRATSEATGGACTIMEMTIAPGNLGGPPHAHSGSELVYMLEGTLEFFVEDRPVQAGPGTCFFFPAGTWEWMRNATDKPARMLVIYSGGHEDEFFREFAEPASGRTLPPPAAGPPDFPRLVAIAEKHGLRIKPPPAH